MNVALTRAQGLLIVIGNPDTLCIDKNWGYFVRYCSDNGAITNKILEEKKVLSRSVKQVDSVPNKAEASNHKLFMLIINIILILFALYLIIKFSSCYLFG